jgi:hypothetical protein
VTLDRLGEDSDMLPFGIVEAGVEPVAPLLPFRQMLDEDSAGDVAGIVDGEPDHARQSARTG